MCADLQSAAADWSEHSELPPLAPGDVHVWRYRLDGPAQAMEAVHPILSPEERARSERFVSAADRRRYLAAHTMLRFVLAGYAGLDPAELTFVQNAAGKPQFAYRLPPPLRFSLSHSRELALGAVTLDHEIGVDLEYVEGRLPFRDIARHFFAPEESTYLEGLPLDELGHAFYRQWVCKEAYLKAAGGGLLMGLDSFSVLFDAAGQPRLFVPDDPRTTGECTIVLLAPERDYVGAVALQGELRRLHQWQWSFPEQ